MPGRSPTPPLATGAAHTDPPGRHRAARQRLRPGTSRALAGSLLAAVGLLTVALRLLGLQRASDLFVDEVIYDDVSASVSDGGFPRTDKGLFFLHPPGFFYLRAGWGKLLGGHPDVVAGVYDGRALNAVLAGVTAVLLMLLVTDVASWKAGVTAGLLFATDPYCIRQNDRAILETATLLWVLAGYLLLIALTRDPLPRRAGLRAAGAGLCFGLAVLTRDQAALITVVPMGAALILSWGPPRRFAAVCGGVAVSCYAIYLIVVAAAGHFGAFWDSKTYGMRRLLGITQATGFNAPRGNALSERLFAELPTFWPTYTLLLLGTVAFAVLVRRKDRTHRLLALFELSAGLALGYALALGTLEEKFLYLLVVPTIAAVTVAASLVLSGRHVPLWRAGTRRYSVLRTLVVVFVAATLAASGVSYARSRTGTEDGFAQLRVYMNDHVPRGSVVVATDGESTAGITKWTFDGDYDVRRAEGNHPAARYAVIPWKLVDDGYTRLTPAGARHLVKGGTLLFSAHSDLYGKLALYRLPPPHPSAKDRPHVPR
ncbi:ArnT family glycosyltransferase [Streptomyces sp. NPDC001102]